MLRVFRVRLTTPVAALFSTTSTKKRNFNEMVNALHVFNQKHGHFVVPPQYQHVLEDGATNGTAASEPYPLGRKLRGLIRKLTKLSPSQRKQLAAISFPVEWQTYYLRQVILPALATFHSRYGHVRVPLTFVVCMEHAEEQDIGNHRPWPPVCAGLRLGHRVSQLRMHAADLDADDVAALNALGFVWNVYADRLHQVILPALVVYQSLHGHPHVPLPFVVPSDDSTWPQFLHRFRLGNAVPALRSSDDPAVRTALAAAGIDLTQSKSDFKWTSQVLPALETFVRLRGHCDVPQAFVVPANDPDWPVATWSLSLGLIVRNVRRGHAYTGVMHKQVLTSLGFLWNFSDKLHFQLHRQVLPALATFRSEFGHVSVPSTFVVPAADPWPRLAHGFALGGWIARRRTDVGTLPHETRFLLEEAGLTWRHFDVRFQQLVLPAFQTYATVHGSCRHMSTAFVVPSEAPWPANTWGLNLGGTLWHIRNGDSFVSDPNKRRMLRQLGVLE
ncbi:hypothetical protein DYB38_012179 [Aphanomyces astaci]|uniref:Helicase-associated domain-containing protein n=2 Tax=Aphanomyces astaci TaxID=112090 RepID=A0A397CI14_APHAT|nr:hypothetical protein DYB38_012179 [Aphanomyces astaci]RHZ14275.1 hypothetical protein DYB31_009718 [Aphanomyces astaci]